MTREDFDKLKTGDIIWHEKSNSNAMVVGKFGEHLLLTAVYLTNPFTTDEWELLESVT